jgi:Outer membrane cobalamin receptor protein
MRVRTLLLLICVNLWFSFSFPAWSAEKDEDADFTAYDLGEIVVSGEKPAAVTEMSVTNEITAEQIKATHSQNVAQALAHAPGVRVSTGAKNEPYISVRGFGLERILVLIDGVPYYEQNYHKLDLSSIPTDNIAKIVITKGAPSVIYGAGAMGGVINIITKKATTKPTASVTFEMGEHGTNRESFSTGWKKGILSYWLNYSHEETSGWRLSDDFKPVLGTISTKKKPTTAVMEDGGFRKNSDSQKHAIWAKLGLEFNPDSEYYVNYYYIDREKGVPPSIREIRQYFTSRPAFTGFNRWPQYDDWALDLSGKQKIFDNLTLRGKLFYHNHQDIYESYDWYDYQNDIADSKYRDSSLGGKFFVDYQPVSWDTLRFSYHLTKDIHKEKNDEYLPYSKSYAYTGSIGMENEFTRIKNLTLVAGVSYDWFDIKGSNYNRTDKKTGDLIGQYDNKAAPIKHSFNPMGGLTYQIDKDTKLFTSVGKKTRFPTLQELYSSKGGNPDLNAEQSVNTTFGVNHAFGNLAWAELAYFYNRISDWISRDTPDPGGLYLNFGDIRMAGFELNTEFYPPWVKNLVLTFDYMYNRAKDHSEGKVTRNVLNIPLHKFDVGLRYTVPRIGTRLDFNAIFVDQVFTRLPTVTYPKDPTIKSDSQMTFDCRISQKFMQYFEAYMAMHNMLDRDYEPGYGFPAIGRTVWFGLTAKY